jgi:hypothetical protein
LVEAGARAVDHQHRDVLSSTVIGTVSSKLFGTICR